MNALKIVREEAYTLATSTQPRKSVHVLSHLSCAFVKSGYSSMQSDELAEQWLGRFCNILRHLQIARGLRRELTLRFTHLHCRQTCF